MFNSSFLEHNLTEARHISRMEQKTLELLSFRAPWEKSSMTLSRTTSRCGLLSWTRDWNDSEIVVMTNTIAEPSIIPRSTKSRSRRHWKGWEIALFRTVTVSRKSTWQTVAMRISLILRYRTLRKLVRHQRRWSEMLGFGTSATARTLSSRTESKG